MGREKEKFYYLSVKYNLSKKLPKLVANNCLHFFVLSRLIFRMLNSEIF